MNKTNNTKGEEVHGGRKIEERNDSGKTNNEEQAGKQIERG